MRPNSFLPSLSSRIRNTQGHQFSLRDPLRFCMIVRLSYFFTIDRYRSQSTGQIKV